MQHFNGTNDESAEENQEETFAGMINKMTSKDIAADVNAVYDQSLLGI